MANETKGMDRLTKQLYYIPTIVGKLGISIAEAQRMLNADFVHNVTQILRLFGVSSSDDATKDPNWVVLSEVLKQLAPPRYQFTESTLEFGADLSESLDLAGGIGVGFGMAGVTVNASFSMGYARDYRAAAKVTSVLHAIPPDTTFGKTLLDRAASIEASNLPLPSNAVVDKAVWDEVAEYRKAITGKTMAAAFTLKALPAAISVAKGANSKVNIKLTRSTDFKAVVEAGFSGNQNGVTIAPAILTLDDDETKNVVTVTVSADAKAGVSTLVVKGVSPSVAPEGCEIKLTVT